MHRNTKLATCCYCGTRAALVLDGGRHELVCSGCGAPLSELKSLRQEKPAKPAAPFAAPAKPKKAKKTRKKPRKKGFKRMFGDILDEIEDIFD